MNVIHLRDDVTSSLIPSSVNNQRTDRKWLWGPRVVVLPVDGRGGEALSFYPIHVSTFIPTFLFSCRGNISVCQRFNDPVASTSGCGQKYIDLFPFSVTCSRFLF